MNNLILELKGGSLDQKTKMETYLLGINLDSKLSELIAYFWPSIPSWQFLQVGEPNEAITSDTHQEIIKKLEVVRAKILIDEEAAKKET